MRNRPSQLQSLCVSTIAAMLSVVGWDPSATTNVQASTRTDARSVGGRAPVAASDPYAYAQARWHDDTIAMKTFRPGYAFWQNIFTIPDGSIAFGSAVDGRL